MPLPLHSASDSSLRPSTEFRQDGHPTAISQGLAQIADHFTDAFFVLNPQGCISFLNQSGLDLIRALPGGLPHPLIGRPFLQILPQFASRPAADHIRKAMEQHQSAAFEQHLSDLNRWFNIRLQPTPHGLHLFLQDITGAKLARDACRASEERYRTLFDSIDEGFCVIEMLFNDAGSPVDYLFLEANPAFEKHTGLQNAVGKTIRQLAPEHEESWYLTYGEVALTGKSVRFESPACALNRWFSVFAFRIGEPEQRRVAILCSDISADIKASTSLRRRNELLSLLSESAHDLLAASDSREMVRQLFARVAPSLGLDVFFNFMVAESGDHLFLDVCGGVTADVEQAFALIPFGCAICGTVAQKQHRIVVPHLQQSTDPKAGPVRALGVRAYVGNPLHVGPRLIGTLSFGSRTRDTFEDEELEFMQTLASYVAMAKERLRISAEHQAALTREQAASQAKDRFLAVLSHELRTPLTPVLMAVASMQTDPGLTPHLREDVLMIRRNVELETKLIDDLLDLNRITSGKLTLQVEAVNLNDIIRRVCDICRPQISEKNLRLSTDLNPAAGQVRADPARLQQIVWNLLKNAVKFTPSHGSITVTSQQPAPGIARFEVRDSGMGITPELLPRIFDAFEQGDPRITRQFGGLGLGLAITKALVDLHKGHITAASQGANTGATFTVDLPQLAATPAPKAALPSDQPSSPPGNPRILIVEDHADTARTLARLLQRAGFHVQVAGDVANALHLLDHATFDVLLSDIGLPDASGFDLMREARQRHLPGIAMSGFGMEEDIRKSHEAGFSEHLVKPVTVQQLVHAIRKLITT